MMNTGGLTMRWSKLVVAFLAILSATFVVAANESSDPKPPYSVEQLRRWHQSMEPWPWLCAPEQDVNLRDDNDRQLLLAISGYARGCTAVLFAKIDDKWLQISNEIEQAHHPLHTLKTSKRGWHDFQSFVPAWGSGGAEVWVSTYTWNGTKYVLMNQEDGLWSDYEPFKNGNNLFDTR